MLETLERALYLLHLDLAVELGTISGGRRKLRLSFLAPEIGGRSLSL